MRDIEITVNKDGNVDSIERFIANQYENKATRLVFDLPTAYLGKGYFHYAVFTLSNNKTIVRQILNSKCVIDNGITNTAGLTLLHIIVKTIEGVDDLSDGLVVCSQPISCFIKPANYDPDNITDESIDENVKLYLDEFDALLAEIRMANDRFKAITDANNNMTEVIDARGGNTVLKNRLDVTDNNIKSNSYDISNNARNIETLITRLNTLSALREGSTTGDAELMDVRIGYDGTAYDNAGTAVRKQISKVNDILNNIKVINTNFFDKVYRNLFDGNYYGGIQIFGNTSYELRKNADFISLAIVPITANTQYSCIVADGGAEDNGYYYFKIASCNVANVNEILENPTNISLTSIFEKTQFYQKVATFTTNDTDNYLLVQASMSKQPFLQIIEGNFDDFTVSSYDESVQGKPNDNLLIYSKNEVDELLKERYIVVKESDTEVFIYYRSVNGYIRYRYFLHTNDSLNLNTWRMGHIWLCDKNRNPIIEVSSTGYDNEGVLKITDEDDYIGGTHGDEQFTEMWLFIDGKQVSIEDIDEVYCNEVKFIVASNIYHANNTTGKYCLSKTKQVIFDKMGIHVNNKWTCLEDMLIYHVRAVLLSINKTCISKYYDSRVFTTPMNVPESGGGKTDSRMTDTYYSGLLSARVWCGERGGDSSMWRGVIADFETRLKSYFDCYTGYNATSGDELYCQNNFIIEY